MADSKVYMFPDSGNGSNMDPALLMSMMNNGGWGGGNWIWVIFLWMMWQNGWGNNGNGNGAGYLGNMMNNNDGRELLMLAIQNNSTAIQNLANMFNTSQLNVMQAINGINNTITGVSNTVGLSALQVINNANQGNNQILSALCNQACSLKEAITAGNYQNQIATLNLTTTLANQISGVLQTLTNEFCRSGYELALQFCDTRQNSTNNTLSLKDNATANTNAILLKLDSMENAAMQDKINTLTALNSALTTLINLTNQNAVQAQNMAALLQPLVAQINAIGSKVSEIENKQPSTITTQYQPYTVIPNYSYGYYGNNAWS